MKTLQGKIFLNNNELSNTEDNLIVFKEVPEVNYYSFLHEADMNGLVQVIIPSSVLISILKHFFKHKKARLVAIKLAEDEDDNIPIINQLISAVNNNRDYFIDLIEELNIPSSFSSIIDADYWLFGLIYYTLFKPENLQRIDKTALANKIKHKIEISKKDEKEKKRPSALKYINKRLNASLTIALEIHAALLVPHSSFILSKLCLVSS